MLPKAHEKHEVIATLTMVYAVVEIAILHITNLIRPKI